MKATTTASETGRMRPAALLALILLATTFGHLAPAFGQNKNDVAISLVAQKVSVGKNGKETLRPANRAFPGEVVNMMRSTETPRRAPSITSHPPCPSRPASNICPTRPSPRPARRVWMA